MNRPQIESEWLDVLSEEFDQKYMHDLREFLSHEKKMYTIYPKMDHLFSAFSYTPFSKVKVVILGQDPYHGEGQAHGLCFSVMPGIKSPPSLTNIYKELSSDLGIPPPNTGCLTEWARQGVFLLNTVLTVRAGQAASHRNRGWERFTDRVITELNERRNRLVFILWGAFAHQKAGAIDRNRHLILKAPHPSPFSAGQGFFGCRHFSKANQYLEKNQLGTVDWLLSEHPAL